MDNTLEAWTTTMYAKQRRLRKKTNTDLDNEVLKTTYKRYRIFCNNLLRTIKRSYENNQTIFVQGRKDNKKIYKYKIIKKFTHNKNYKTP